MSAPMSQGPTGPSTLVLAVDTGGTFTDLVLLAEGVITTLKLPSTKEDPSQAVIDGIRQILDPEIDFALLHGSTVATNALLERSGARVVLITNEGFEDIIEIGRQNRPQLYALVGHRPPPLVHRTDRLGVTGRIGPTGDEISPLDQQRVAELPEAVSELGAESIAISLLHAYANDEHERVLSKAVEALGLPLSVSSVLVPEFREYERTSTTVVNAYVAPLMDHYLGRLSNEAGASRVTIMGSNGGVLPVARARREPVRTVLSGPAGGVMGALTWARRAGQDSIISFDMGGTSTDVSLCPGQALRTREFEIAGQPVAIPVIDIHTVGAGGGSIARMDPGGALRVGPESAGADPGPICYGMGGTEVTVTDAHVWLGRLPPNAFPVGDSVLDRNSIREPLQRLADELDSTMSEAAEGVLAVANTAMERALRVISVERGFDPIDFALVAFGGAGGLHVAELLKRLGASKAIVPPDPGLLSAYGMLASPVTRERSRTVLVSSATSGSEQILITELEDLEADAREAMLSEGSDPSTLTAEHWVDARYQGQSFELAVPAQDWIGRFHRSHFERYGYERPETPVEAVTLRVTVSAPSPDFMPASIDTGSGPPPSTSAETFISGELVQVESVRRQDLLAGHELSGPAVIQEYSATTWVPQNFYVQVDQWGCLHLITAD